MIYKKPCSITSDESIASKKATNTAKILLQKQKVGVLATICFDKPYTSIVGFSVTDDLKAIYFATPMATLKYKNLLSNSNVSLLIDNRQNLGTDFSEAAAITCIGKALNQEGEEKEFGRDLLIEKHPELINFLNSPTCKILKIGVSKYSIVTRFQEVTEIEFDDKL